MASYLSLRRDAERSSSGSGSDRLLQAGRAAERRHQAAENDAWEALRAS